MMNQRRMGTYVQQIQLLLLGRNSAGKTTLANILSNKKQSPQVTTDTYTTECEYSPDNKSNYKITITDTMGVSNNSMPWSRIDQLSRQKHQAVLLVLISAIDQQSFIDSQKIIEGFLNGSLQNQNSRVMVILNLYEKTNCKVNKDEILKYFYLRNIRVFQFCLIKTRRQDIFKKIYLRHVINTYKSQSEVLDSFKICILGTNFSKKQLLFSKLTGNHIKEYKTQSLFSKLIGKNSSQKYKTQTNKSSIKINIGKNTFQLQIWIYEDIDSSDTVKWMKFWGNIKQSLNESSKNDGKPIFDKVILVINNQMIQNETQNKTNVDILKALKDKKYPSQIILYKPFVAEVIDTIKSLFGNQETINQTNKKYQNKKNYQIPIYDIDKQSSQRSFAWALQDLISQKIFKEKKAKQQQNAQGENIATYFQRQYKSSPIYKKSINPDTTIQPIFPSFDKKKTDKGKKYQYTDKNLSLDSLTQTEYRSIKKQKKKRIEQQKYQKKDQLNKRLKKQTYEQKKQQKKQWCCCKSCQIF